jgi:hypothetical protein
LDGCFVGGAGYMPVMIGHRVEGEVVEKSDAIAAICLDAVIIRLRFAWERHNT